MVEVRAASFAEILDAEELLLEYAAECALPELAPINPQREMYAAMERTGAFQCFGVFDQGVLVGFATVLTFIVPHYGKKIATAESLFLAAAHRSAGPGNRLLQTVERYAREQGCVAILYSAPAGSQFERLLRARKPYRHSNTVFLRSL